MKAAMGKTTMKVSRPKRAISRLAARKDGKPKELKPKSTPMKKATVNKVYEHPKYLEMVKEAILGLHDRTGSSSFAIGKFIQQHHPSLPANWKRILATQLKNLAKTGKLVKVKASFKISDDLKNVRGKEVKKSVKKLMQARKVVTTKKVVAAPKPKSAAKEKLKKLAKGTVPAKLKKITTSVKSTGVTKATATKKSAVVKVTVPKKAANALA